MDAGCEDNSFKKFGVLEAGKSKIKVLAWSGEMYTHFKKEKTVLKL